ncbi:MAG: tRNA 4-thiouridine(8) synthase ThiI [Thermoplasmata archaeon]|jgi:thiamine biosynthesis protein ThiI|nr:tRNA 4-thiouridine(8) synthase ThiI [Thermoplasmata archaeon]
MKLVSLMSNGIDSPVASYIMSRAGADVILLHMDNRPFTDDRSMENVRALAEKLREATGKDIPLYSAPHGENQKAISEGCDSNYQCVMCKIVMQRTAVELAKRLGASGVIMGDSLGQVASQTLRNIRAESIGLDLPIVRPLIGMDKTEIVSLAREIGTFDISIRPTDGCLALPPKVVVDADPEKSHDFMQAIDVRALAKRTADAAVLLRMRDYW